MERLNWGFSARAALHADKIHNGQCQLKIKGQKKCNKYSAL